MTAPTHLHHWLDAIQRGQVSASENPQLVTDVPIPSAEEQVWLRQFHEELTGQTLDARWLTHVLQPMSDGAMTNPEFPSSDEDVRPVTGWRRWQAWFRQHQERPAHDLQTQDQAQRSFRKWQRATRWAGLVTMLTLGGGNGWIFGRLAPKFAHMEEIWKAGVKAAGSVTAFRAQPLAHQLQATMLALDHELLWSVFVLILGMASLAVTLSLDTLKSRRKPVKPSVERRLSWQLSPRAQRYLQQRTPGQPFLLADLQRLNDLAASDRVASQMVPAPLADRPIKPD